MNMKNNKFFKMTLSPRLISVIAIIISISGIYIQFFHVHHRIDYATLLSSFNEQNKIFTPILFKNSGNQTELILNTYLQLDFYTKDGITEKRISDLYPSEFPIILSPGESKKITLEGNLKQYMFGMYKFDLIDSSYFYYDPVTVFDNLRLSIKTTYLSSKGKMGEEIRDVGFITFNENESVKHIVYNPIKMKRLNLKKNMDIISIISTPFERTGKVSIDLKDSASVIENIDKIQLLNRILNEQK